MKPKTENKKISPLTIVLIILSIFLLINILYIANNLNNISAYCDSKIEKLGEYPQEYSYMEADGIMSCVASEWDSKNNLTTTFYIMLISVLLTILSWKIDKIKNR